MSNYGYGQNPYDQRTTGQAPYPTGGGYESYGGQQQSQGYGQQPQTYGRQQYNQAAYNQNQYSQPQMGRDDYNNQNVELEPLAPNGQQYGRQNNGGSILDECAAIKTAVTDLKSNKLANIENLQRMVLNDPDASPTSRNAQALEQENALLMQTYRSLADRVKRLKSKPESGSPTNSKQVGATSRLVQSAITDFQNLDANYQKSLKQQMARQYRIVRPEASEEEVREAVEDTQSQQVFSQALLQGNRRGQAQSALNAVQSRHEAIQKIERQMIELAELFQDMENMVVQQEAAVTNIEMKGEEVVENMDNGTKQIDVAVKTARATRKKKWWCLGICVLIIVIIVVVILLWQFVFGPNAKKPAARKRWVLPSADVLTAFPAAIKPCSKSHTEIVAPEVAATLELVKRALHFRA